MRAIVTDDAAVAFVMEFVDRAIRPDSNPVAANQLAAVVDSGPLPSFLSPIDRLLLRAGARLGSLAPSVVMPAARRRMRSIIGHLVAPGEPEKLKAHLARRREAGFALNVNLLGEAVLGESEAQRRLQDLLRLLDQPSVDYVSVKISSVASQLNHFAHDDSLRRVSDRLRILLRAAANVQPATFLNLDMEEYHDLELTLTAFMKVLDEPAFRHVDAGIVLQAYLPDSYPALQRLVAWSNRRHDAGGGETKIRLVKGANLAMEKVDAAMHGWEQAPYSSKVETDANYKRCIDWLLVPERLAGVRLGLASHNLFDVAWTRLLSMERGVADRVQFEMLQGMAPAQAAVVSEAVGQESSMLMYTPAVRSEDFDVAISYLFRRLEENAADENFMRHLFDLDSDPDAFTDQAEIFREAMARRHEVEEGPRRRQDRSQPPSPTYVPGEPFRNEPDTDPSLVANRSWIADVVRQEPSEVEAPITTAIEEIDRVLTSARSAAGEFSGTNTEWRRDLLHRIGDELAKRRGLLISTMMHEANKTFAEADVEVSEAIDFARWYGDRALDLAADEYASFTPFGTVAVVPPWNFPVAIPAGGVLACLAAGNTVVFKPAPETPRCAEIVAQACWAAGVSPEVLQFVRTPDDEVGQHLIVSADAVILTGGAETADLFRSWKPDLRLLAETSGKNALIVSPNADIDLAVADLAGSAFGHSGQKCSAASLGILVGPVYDSERLRRQLVDAVRSLTVDVSTRIETNMGPLISEPNERLQRGLTTLDEGESWLLRPAPIKDTPGLWSPGIRLGVQPGSWFHRTECFGPVLGLMRADDLEHATAIQNSSEFGLTGGIHTLDPNEIDAWVAQVEVGNAYVNRAITGAIVQRQPFGGWKRSSVGPGAKAGGPNYVAQLGTWASLNATQAHDYAGAWAEHFAVEHDPTGLFCESNVFRYRPLDVVLLRVEEPAAERDLELVREAARTAGVRLIESNVDTETQAELASRLGSLDAQRIRLVGGSAGPELHRAANSAHLHIADDPVTASGRIELQHYVREQAVTRTLHRFGNLTNVRRDR